MKELVIECRIPLPADYFEEAEVVANLKNACDDFRSAIANAADDHSLSVKTQTKREASGKPRKPRTPRAPANGATDQPVA